MCQDRKTILRGRTTLTVSVLFFFFKNLDFLLTHSRRNIMVYSKFNSFSEEPAGPNSSVQFRSTINGMGFDLGEQDLRDCHSDQVLYHSLVVRHALVHHDHLFASHCTLIV